MKYHLFLLSELKKVKYLLFEFLKIIIQYIHSLFIFNNKDLGNISFTTDKNILINNYLSITICNYINPFTAKMKIITITKTRILILYEKFKSSKSK